MPKNCYPHLIAVKDATHEQLLWFHSCSDKWVEIHRKYLTSHTIWRRWFVCRYFQDKFASSKLKHNADRGVTNFRNQTMLAEHGICGQPVSLRWTHFQQVERERETRLWLRVGPTVYNQRAGELVMSHHFLLLWRITGCLGWFPGF